MTTIHIDGTAPVYQHAGDAGADLTATEGAVLHSGQSALIPTGLRAAIPTGHAGLVVPRSGLALKSQVTVLNAPGLIDSGYRGEVGVILINHGPRPFVVRKGDRVAQLVIVPTVQAEFVPGLLDATDRGSGAFGSTGAA